MDNENNNEENDKKDDEKLEIPTGKLIGIIQNNWVTIFLLLMMILMYSYAEKDVRECVSTYENYMQENCTCLNIQNSLNCSCDNAGCDCVPFSDVYTQKQQSLNTVNPKMPDMGVIQNG